MLDTRRHIRRLMDSHFKPSLQDGFVKFLLSLLFALLAAYLPDYGSLGSAGVDALFIMLFAAALWVSEAIPAFAVALLVIALEIVLLGFPGFDFAGGGSGWEIYLKPWSSPLVFLFFAGFVMAAAASKTKLDLWLAKKVLFFVGGKPRNIVTGLMVVTFLLSMFVSNTATTAMMLAVLIPILASMRKDNPFQKAVLLAVTVAANIGGMGTIIGTPPNAIAVGVLGSSAPSFVAWTVLALPPAIIIAVILRFVILWRYPSNEAVIDLEKLQRVDHYDDSTTAFTAVPTVPSWKKSVVAFVFIATVLLWLTGPLHHIPTTVVSLLPVVIFTLVGIIDVEDIQSLRWDVILLIIGGLALGVGVSTTGLAAWFAGAFDLEGSSMLVVTLLFAYLVVIVSNFMSNTAATNVMLPIVVAFGVTIGEGGSQAMVIAVALSASFAMSLPVSTPPNAIVYASGRLASQDFLLIGLLTAVIGPPVVLGWLFLIS